MKSDAQPRTPSTARVGIVDAIGTGLTEAARRPWLWIVPIVVDLVLWLAPRLSMTSLAQRTLAEWTRTLSAYSAQLASVGQDLQSAQDWLVGFVKSVNLASAVTAGWLAPPSAFAPAQASRYLMISDAVLTPIPLGFDASAVSSAPWQTTSVELTSFGSVLAVVAALWLIGQLVAALYFRMVAVSLQSQPLDAKPTAGRSAGEPREDLLQGWLPLAARFAAVSLFASLSVLMLRVPLLLVTLLAVVSGSPASEFLFVVGGGITLWLTMWFLSSLFFVGDALAFDRQTVLPSLMQSLILTRLNAFRALILAVLVNVLVLAARTVWRMIGDNSAGALLAIIANGYLATAMTIGIYVYYQDLRRHWQTAQVGRQLSK